MTWPLFSCNNILDWQWKHVTCSPHPIERWKQGKAYRNCPFWTLFQVKIQHKFIDILFTIPWVKLLMVKYKIRSSKLVLHELHHVWQCIHRTHAKTTSCFDVYLALWPSILHKLNSKYVQNNTIIQPIYSINWNDLVIAYIWYIYFIDLLSIHDHDDMLFS